MLEKIKTVRLGDITPSDVPRHNSWAKVIARYGDRSTPCFTTLQDLNIELRETSFHGLVPLDGNHRLARLIQLLGENMVVGVALTSGLARYPRLPLQPTYLDERVAMVQELGITSFADFINACTIGDFSRFTAISQGLRMILPI